MLLASRPPSLLLYTHLSLGSGDRSEAGSEGGWKGLPISAHTTGFLVNHVRIRSKGGNLRPESLSEKRSQPYTLGEC